LPVWIYLISITMFSGDIDDSRFVWFWCGTVVAGCRFAQQEFDIDWPLQNARVTDLFSQVSTSPT
jgi:hypothetical protein